MFLKLVNTWVWALIIILLNSCLLSGQTFLRSGLLTVARGWAPLSARSWSVGIDRNGATFCKTQSCLRRFQLVWAQFWSFWPCYWSFWSWCWQFFFQISSLEIQKTVYSGVQIFWNCFVEVVCGIVTLCVFKWEVMSGTFRFPWRHRSRLCRNRVCLGDFNFWSDLMQAWWLGCCPVTVKMLTVLLLKNQMCFYQTSYTVGIWIVNF